MADATLLGPRRAPPARAARPGGPPREALAIEPLALPPDPDLVALLPPSLALGAALLPWRQLGPVTVVACADLAAAARHAPLLREALGPFRLARAEVPALREALARALGRPLARAAEVRVAAEDSARTLPRRALTRAGLAGLALLLVAAAVAPLALAAATALLAALVLVLSAGLRLAAAAATLRRDRTDDGAEVVPARLPLVSLLVPLYREGEVVADLLGRMAALDYPPDRLDLCLVVEDDDGGTREALAALHLPPWAQVVEVPEGTLRTKPRALNFALGFARGSIVGIYDAEDKPAADHLRRVASHFARRGPQVACLQGALDYYNARSNWLSRCFTLEYASWFRVLLPGMVRLGLVIPLGGTTLFLRRAAIEALGGWDAHNVTEDADLGIRLARRGLRTEMVAITTMEEANARPRAWVRQRSRWLKGYAQTYAVHMRDPARLWRDLGPRRFLGFQVLILGTLVQFALAPVLWSFWLIPLGLPHPLAPLLPPVVLVSLSILFLAAQALDLAFAWLGVRRAGRPALALWGPALQLYFPLATLAVYRALWELAACPFLWHKTQHGIDAPEEEAAAGLGDPDLTVPPLPVARRSGGAWRRRG